MAVRWRGSSRMSWGSFFLIFAAITTDNQSARGARPASDEAVRVLHFETMVYPIYAQVRLIEGVVVLRASTDGDGRVTGVTELSGPKALLSATKENLTKWRFGSPKPGTAVVVYWFRIRGVCEPPCHSGTEFYPPHIMVVTTGKMIATE